MFVRVNIEEGAWTDRRFAILANVLGYSDAHHALIKCAALWSWQTANFSPDAPTYIVDADTLDACLDRSDSGPALVRAKLAEETPDGYRIKGSQGRIEWLWKCRQNAPKGGAATKRLSGNSTGSAEGHPASPAASHPASDCEVSNNEGPPGKPPAGPGAGPPSGPSSALLLFSSPTEKKSDSPKASRPVSSRSQVIGHWNGRFRGAYGSDPTWGIKPEGAVDRLLSKHQPETIRQRIDAAFDAPPKWPTGPYDFETFARHFDKFVRAGPTSHGHTEGIRPTNLL